MNKYKITAIEHPQYPWLHRIQALIDVNEKVPKGTIGGFVDSITNLSQGGGCWIYDDAICCEGGLVREEAEIYDDSMVRGTAVVAGKARIYNHAVAKDSCYISSGEIKDDAVIAGKAIIGSLCLQKPLISGDSRVYGMVQGNVHVNGNIFHGKKLKRIRRTHIFLNMDNGVFHQQSKNYSHHYIILERRPKRKIHRNDKGDSMSKYKITEIEHPQYPWLHRIQALIDVNEKVPEGTLGGFVENENNLSQEGTCWIYDDAICCENGEVKEEAALYDGSLVRGYAVVTGDATFYDRAVAKRDCYICGGEIKENAIISGKAFIDTVGVNAPVIGGESHVYGEVRGNIYIKGDIFPWDIFNNHTKDMFLYENGKWRAFSVPEKLKPPKSYQKKQTKKKNQPER